MFFIGVLRKDLDLKFRIAWLPLRYLGSVRDFEFLKSIFSLIPVCLIKNLFMTNPK